MLDLEQGDMQFRKGFGLFILYLRHQPLHKNGDYEKTVMSVYDMMRRSLAYV